MRCISALLAVLVAQGCGGKSQNCVGTVEAASNRAVGTSDCISLGGVGAPGTAPNHFIVDVMLGEGVQLELQFPSSVKAPAMIDLATDPQASTAALFDYRGFEGGRRELCMPAAPKSGTFKLTSITTKSDGSVESVTGTVDVRFSGCSIEAWPGSGSDIHVNVSF